MKDALNQSRWEFWIDVGGTFTDCIARGPDHCLYRHKLLSSGVFKGTIGGASDAGRICDHRLSGFPSGFWESWNVRLLDREGIECDRSEVKRFHAADATLILAAPFDSAPVVGSNYELSCDEEAPLIAIRCILGLKFDQPIPVVDVRLGTTRGTNALLTRSGAPTALITTKGFQDILEIGNQDRPNLFELDIRKPSVLYAATVEIDERISSDGIELQELDPEAVQSALQSLKRKGVHSFAICFMNAYANPIHELQVATIARELGFQEISLSHRVSPLAKIVARGETTVLDAYLNPVLRTYTHSIRSTISRSGPSQLRMMTSAGGLVGVDSFSGKDSVLSGPAGGVVGFANAAIACGIDQAIGFDMGGTSTDVARFEGTFEQEFETQKAGVRIVAPMMAIHTVAAGGGSICKFDGIMLSVGPESAGADPGPACYGHGGPLTVTDVNLFLGKLLPDHFPFALDTKAVENRLRIVQQEVTNQTGKVHTPEELACGFVRIANANMSEAIREISIGKGFDVREYTLVAFGGAAGQHACCVAAELGIRQILIHPDAGILSAMGIGFANIKHQTVKAIYRPLHEIQTSLPSIFRELEHQASRMLVAEGILSSRVRCHRMIEMRYLGTETPLLVHVTNDDFQVEFDKQHERLYGYLMEHRPLEVVSARCEAVGESMDKPHESFRCPASTPHPIGVSEITFDSRREASSVFDRSQLEPGNQIQGPALIVEQHATTIVDPGWQVEVLSRGELLFSDTGTRTTNITPDADPVTLEIFNRHFEAIARQMGVTLRNTAVSVNVKERLDFSCALFTAAGDLVVNAPHIPVHLGAMSETVKAIIHDHPVMHQGDVFITNDPYRGGSHLPDVTLVSPVFSEDGSDLLFFTASRAHHAEIGGITPGSMPPFSENLAQEGVLIRSFKVIDQGQSRMEVLQELLQSGPFPSRDVESNMADVAAQIAANRFGSNGLARLIERYSWPVVRANMGHIQRAAETKMRQALSKIPNGTYEFCDRLDNGARIKVEILIDNDEAQIDFSGTDDVLDNNLNANPAIVTAAVIYVLRCLIDEPIPLNQGVLAPVQIEIPTCLLNPPSSQNVSECHAIAGGNVETSQRVVDVLLGALKLAAASQGTMNNVLFGDDSFGYYETICGGAGATATSDGCHAVHTHMTNTRLTDPEILEQRYPVRLNRFVIRQNSGGKGRHTGGNGVLRELEFLRPLTVSLLTQRRSNYPPFGMDGGMPGQSGNNSIHTVSGDIHPLGGCTNIDVKPGDRLIVQTPGGGGYGPFESLRTKKPAR